MNWKDFIFIGMLALCNILVGILIGVGIDRDINEQSYLEYNDLENENIELRWKLDSCYTQIEDLEDYKIMMEE